MSMSRRKITDEELTKLMSDLPRRPASAGFTSEVLKRLDGRRNFVLRHPWAVAAAALAVVVLGISIVGVHPSRQSDRPSSLERIESLRNEYRELEAEFEELRSLTRELDPVIELGGTDRVDFVFDLRELARENNRSGLQPVSHTSEEKR